MPFLESEAVERVVIVFLKILAAALVTAAGKYAERIATSVVSRVARGCPEKAEQIGQCAAEKVKEKQLTEPKKAG